MRSRNTTVGRRNAQTRGFTLLLAALIASIVLSVGAAISSIANKQVLLSMLGRDSQYAFYMADTGAECALFWDTHFTDRTVFGEPSPMTIDTSYFATPTLPATLLKCDGQSPSSVEVVQEQAGDRTMSEITANNPNFSDYYPYTKKFQFQTNDRCVIVKVRKYLEEAVVATRIRADGYNIRCDQTSTARAIQRSIELKY